MTVDRDHRIAALRAHLARRILVLDGAMGTSIQAHDLDAADFGGPELEGCNENLVLTRPDVIRGIHEGFLAAGADIVETDTFGATPLVLAEYGLAATGARDQRRRGPPGARRGRGVLDAPTGRASSPARWDRRPRRSR